MSNFILISQPPVTTFNVSQAQEKCKNSLFQSVAGKECKAVKEVNFDEIIESCTQDLVVSFILNLFMIENSHINQVSLW